MSTLSRWYSIGSVLALLSAAPAGGAAELAGSPWTLAEIRFDFAGKVEFESYSIDLTLRRDLDPGIPLLIAPIIDAEINGETLSVEARTQAGGYHFTHQHDRESVPSAAALRIDGQYDPRIARIARDDGMYDWATGPEPYLASVLPMVWAKGRYTLHLRKESQRRLNGSPYTWIGYYVYSHRSGTEAFVGSIRFPGTSFTLSGTVGAAVAIPAEGLSPDAIPRTALTLGAWRINEETVLPLSATARYPTAAPAGAVCILSGKEIAIQIGPNRDRSDIDGLRVTDGAYQHTLFSRSR